MSNEDGRRVELCGLWEHKTKEGKLYFSGNMGNAKVLVFKNSRKGDNEKSPDYHVYLVPKDRPQVSFVKKGPFDGFEEKGKDNTDDLGF